MDLGARMMESWSVHHRRKLAGRGGGEGVSAGSYVKAGASVKRGQSAEGESRGHDRMAKMSRSRADKENDVADPGSRAKVNHAGNSKDDTSLR